MVGCLGLLFVVYPLGILITTGLNPLPFVRKTGKVAFFGAATQSSAATLPLNMKTVSMLLVFVLLSRRQIGRASCRERV